MLSIVATETSALTVISIPGIAARGDLTFLQLAFGYLVGRIGVAALLLPGYFQGTQETAYQRLEHRFGTAARRTASGIFLVTRALADCVRIFATAIPLAIITHWSLALGILAIGIVTCVYTWIGGLRDARKALIGSGAFIIGQFALFLLVGTALWLAGADHVGMRSDAIYPTFVVTQLPAGLAGLVVASILAAAMSSHASAVNSLASASPPPCYVALTGRRDAARLLGVGRRMTLACAALLAAGAVAFRPQAT